MKGTIALVATHLGGEFMLFVRNVVLARMLGPSDMGIAMMFAMSLRLLEMSTESAVDRFMIQSRIGNNPRVQSNAQGILLVRGILTGCFFAVVSIPLARLLGEPDSAIVLACLGIVPVIKGMVHLDHKRCQRQLSFQSSAVVEIVAGCAALLACVPAYSVFPDYRAALLVIGAQAIAWAVLSHWVSDRRYSLRFDRPMIRRMVGFGLPFAANGLLMFAILQGDRLIVAFSCTPEELGIFAIVAQFSLIPVLIISRVANSYYLPLLSREQRDMNAFHRQMTLGMVILGAVSGLYGLAFCSLGNWAIATIYCPAYAASAPLIGWLTVMGSIRLLRAMPSVSAVSLGDTRQPLVANVFRSLGLVAAGIAGFFGYGIATIVAAGCAGELLSLLIAIGLLNRAFGISFSTWLPAVSIASGGVILGWILGHSEDLSGNAQVCLAAIAALLIGSQWRVYVNAFGTLGNRIRGVHQGFQI